MGLLGLARRVIVGHSTRLLLLAIAFGVAMASASFVMVADIVINKLSNSPTPVSGWASVMSGVLFTAGVTNIMLGLIGLYIAELFERTKGRPIYVVRKQVGGAPHGGASMRPDHSQDAGKGAT
jgi:dolichol-phosphate mannosyltransferase